MTTAIVNPTCIKYVVTVDAYSDELTSRPTRYIEIMKYIYGFL